MIFTVTDLKQMLYCPRILYYNQCLPRLVPRTDKMDAGRDLHRSEEGKEARRSFSPYGLTSASRHFDVWLSSEKLGLSGRVDLVLEAPDGAIGQAWIVDYKLSKQVAQNWKLQLAAYALLLEEQWEVKVNQGFVYLIPLRRAEPISLTTRLKHRAEATLAQMQQIEYLEWMPEPPKSRAKCRDCEFRRFCNDV